MIKQRNGVLAAGLLAVLAGLTVGCTGAAAAGAEVTVFHVDGLMKTASGAT